MRIDIHPEQWYFELDRNINTKSRPKVIKVCNYLPHFGAYNAHKELYLDFKLNIEEKYVNVIPL